MKLLEKFENFIVLVFLGMMFVILLFQIILRYFFNHPLIWSEELARYLFVWVAFIGASFGVRDSSHIKLTVIFNFFSKKLRTVISASTNIVCILFFIYLIPDSIRLAADQFSVASSAIGLPMGLVFLAVPVGFVLMSIRLLIDTIGLFRKTTQ